ncbi:MAG: SDR family oxidoreductase ['Candidatus Kapabacteria' thiocyanatum]|mgnify:CR=1 FL=1|uniref:Short-chain dehydrogenase n=1 Tax=Candidatus Kapaibacterium thiocyanatum TaxID=1895771 RepID=A0A1M3L706_9BACT|nr:SDR family oxidoreductase ['Candidatus Kapabacteria' thiocyanatum]OJX61346.1 MAG: hypothetical protein BGO89_01870 ['Candidatus Kapabacteria' thiocyanatum]
MSVVIITGGARRMGRALALRFAERGYDVGITYRRSQEEAMATLDEVRAHGVRCSMQSCDVSDDTALARALQGLADDLGPCGVVVSNAGVFPDPQPAVSIAPDLVRATIGTNTMPVLTIAQWYGALLTAQGRTGRLVSIGSLGALELWKDRLAYNVSKSALLTMTQALARGMAPVMTVNTVAPGAILLSDDPSPADAAMARMERIPMGRHGNADDIFDAVWFYATASTYITGQLIAVDGGYHLVR